MAFGGPDVQKISINAMRHTPVQCFLGGAAVLFMMRQYQTHSTYNYWFGKIEYERRVERNELWISPNTNTCFYIGKTRETNNTTWR